MLFLVKIDVVMWKIFTSLKTIYSESYSTEGKHDKVCVSQKCTTEWNKEDSKLTEFVNGKK